MFQRLYCLLLLILSSVESQEVEWEGCLNRELPNKVRIGELTRVCLQVANGVNWAAGVNYVRASFEPVADDYSYYHIPNTYKDLISTAGTLFTRKNITVGAASQKSLSFLRMYFDAEKQRVYPYLTAIMDVHKGVVRGITWDDACVFCGALGNSCEENTYSFTGVQQTPETSGQKTKSCYIEKEECDVLLNDNPQSRACDLQLYTVWTGTDVEGKALQSQAFRFSEFPVQKSKDRLTQLIPGFLRNYVDNPAAENTTEAVSDL